MKLNLQKFVHFFKHRSLPSKRGLISAHRDWHIILFSFFVAMLFVIGGHYMLFKYLSKGVSTTAGANSGPKLKTGELTKKAASIQERINRHEKLLSSPRPTIDPS